MNRLKIAHLYLAIFMVLFSPACALGKPDNDKSHTGVRQTKRYLFVGNSYSKKFHLPQCEFARKMSVYHVRLIETRDEALKKQFKACNWCMPKWTKSVSSKIVSSQRGVADKTRQSRVSESHYERQSRASAPEMLLNQNNCDN